MAVERLAAAVVLVVAAGESMVVVPVIAVAAIAAAAAVMRALAVAAAVVAQAAAVAVVFVVEIVAMDEDCNLFQDAVQEAATGDFVASAHWNSSEHVDSWQDRAKTLTWRSHQTLVDDWNVVSKGRAPFVEPQGGVASASCVG